MSVTKEGSSREAGVKLPVPGAAVRALSARFAAVSQVFENRESGSVPQVDSEANASAIRRAKALPDCICNLPCTAVGARLHWWLVTAKVPRCAAQATTKVATGLNACPSYVAAAVDRFGGPRGLFLGWKMRFMHHARGLAVSDVMLLQRDWLLRAALGRLPREVALNTVCSQRLGGFLDDLCREGLLNQIIRFSGARAIETVGPQ